MKTLEIEFRDFFLSHRTSAKEFVRKLASDIENEIYNDRNLLTWVDEAEIKTGSVTGDINHGLEISRFFGVVMTPEYFESQSGWTDAEWHAALHLDPDNRRGRIIPLLVEDCPYIPVLLRHLGYIDFRGTRYSQALQKLLRILRDEPLPRPVIYRGQLIDSSGRINRATLMTERAVPEGDPDSIHERLYCNLLPVERLPKYIYTAPIAYSLRKPRNDGSNALPNKQELKDLILRKQLEDHCENPYIPAFRLVEDNIITFNDLESSEGLLNTFIVEDEAERIPVEEFIRDEDDRKIIISLMNMAIGRHAIRLGLVADDTKKNRFFFPPLDGNPRTIEWKPKKRKASRTVAKPYFKDEKLMFWLHSGVYLNIIFIANKFYLFIKPTWMLTEDGQRVIGGSSVGRIIVKWTGAERNLQVLYHVRFWSTILRHWPGPIHVRAGDQWLELASTPGMIENSYGIIDDQKDIMRELDEVASLIAEQEMQKADTEIEHASLHALFEIDDDEILDIEMDEGNESHDE